MPNLKQLLKLNAKYSSDQATLNESEIERLFESFDPNYIEKGFRSERTKTKLFAFTEKTVSNYALYFNERRKVEAVLLFIDVTSFSKRFVSKTADEVASYLDRYYSKVLPVIREFGGEIEKIIGDGIICVFGEPFIELDKIQLHRKAEKCCMSIISELKGTNYEVKIALHFGEIMYYQNDSDDYWEYTMIGNTLTDLFRLESVARTNCINFYTNTYFDHLQISDVKKTASRVESTHPAAWTLKNSEEVKLIGTPFTSIRRLEKN